MNSLPISLFLCCLFTLVVGKNFWSKSADAKEIEAFLKLLADSKYDSRIPPIGRHGPGTPVEVEVSMYILDISKIDDYSMDFQAQFYFRQSWNDSRLKVRYSDEYTITLPNVDLIWTPDLFFVEEKEGSLHKIVTPNMFCKINSDGEVLYSSKFSVVFSCPMDLRKYPHDVQECTISIESYGSQRKQMQLTWSEERHAAVLASPNISLIAFDITDITKSIQYSTFQSGEYSALQVHLTFTRKSGLLVSTLYMPFTVLVMLSWLSFWISTDEKCLRLALLLVILYLTVTLCSEVNRSIITTSYLKSSDIWIGFCESLVVAVFLEFIIINLLSKAEEDKANSNDDEEMKVETEFGKELKPDSSKSTFDKLMNMFNARNPRLAKGNSLPCRIDRICRILFPLIFIVFNIVYWSVCFSA